MTDKIIYYLTTVQKYYYNILLALRILVKKYTS